MPVQIPRCFRLKHRHSTNQAPTHDYNKQNPVHGGRSARDLFSGSGFIHKEYIMNPLKILHFHLKMFLPRPRGSGSSGKNIQK